MKPQTTLNAYISQAIRDNWEHPALSNYKGGTLTYADVARKVAKLHIVFHAAGLRPGDKIAFCGRNCAEWAVAVLASITYGTVSVPILNDFKPETICHLVNHSDARILFTDAGIWEHLDPEEMKNLESAVLISDYSALFSRNRQLDKARENLNRLFGEKYPSRFSASDVDYPSFPAEAIGLINYTSGSTGFSKGVMITYGNMWSNIQFSIDGLSFLLPGDGFVSMLPLAHMFGLMIEFLHPLVKGCHIYFLSRTPSPKILLDVFAEVRPKLIIAVPLILEKIVKTRVFPTLRKPVMRILLHVPGLGPRILAKVRLRLLDAFGGNLRQIIVGGAPLDKDVAAFLTKIKFPFTIGYGMTECAPLIAYLPWDRQRPGSCGKVVDRMEVRVDSDDPEHIPGVLWVRGANVMQGYYKNPEATAEVFNDGWMNTGDICAVDSDGYIYIRGRDKNMILGPSGQNIYPEEIEQKLNNLPFVAESLVVSRDNKLVALVVPDRDAAFARHMSDKELDDIMHRNIGTLNSQIPSYSQVSGLEIMPEEFEKTPKRSIKRFLYK